MNYLNFNSIQIGLIAICFIVEVVLIIIHSKLSFKLNKLRISGKIPDIVKTDRRKKAAIFMIIAIPILVATVITSF
jgi:hypothetical protein